MGDILSQEEIDRLMEALTSGGPDKIESAPAANEKPISVYNFARPSKFGKEQLRTLEVVFENFSRIASSYLTGYLRTGVTIEVKTAEQMTYSEFSNSLSNPAILAITEFKPMKGSIIFEMAASLGYVIIDRILGGSGEAIKTRDYTEIELILLTRIINQMISFLVEPWENISDISPRLDKLETNPQFAQIISPNEMIALVTLAAKIGENEGMMNFCIPYIVIEPIIGNLNTKHWFAVKDEEDKERYKPHVEKQLEKAKIPISVIVGRTGITVEQFIDLQIGDVITLDSYVNSDFQVMVGDLLKFYGKPGISRGKNAIQITSVISRENKKHEEGKEE